MNRVNLQTKREAVRFWNDLKNCKQFCDFVDEWWSFNDESGAGCLCTPFSPNIVLRHRTTMPVAVQQIEYPLDSPQTPANTRSSGESKKKLVNWKSSWKRGSWNWRASSADESLNLDSLGAMVRGLQPPVMIMRRYSIVSDDSSLIENLNGEYSIKTADLLSARVRIPPLQSRFELSKQKAFPCQ